MTKKRARLSFGVLSLEEGQYLGEFNIGIIRNIKGLSRFHSFTVHEYTHEVQ